MKILHKNYSKISAFTIEILMSNAVVDEEKVDVSSRRYPIVQKTTLTKIFELKDYGSAR